VCVCVCAHCKAQMHHGKAVGVCLYHAEMDGVRDRSEA
jgi:hypothetical protein